MIDQLPPELAKLIAAEKVAPAADHALRTLVRAKLAASVTGVPLGAAAAGGLGAGKVLAILAIVAGAGTVAVVKSQRARPLPAAVVAPLVTRAEPPPPPPVPAEPATVTTASAVQAEPPVQAVVPSQADLLRDAWSALSHGDADHALELAVRDMRVHATGALSEERDALRILALAKLGRSVEAATANTTFIEHYPNSIHRALIDKALAGAP